MKILISGFEPFASHTENTSQVMIGLIPQSSSLTSVLLPVTFEEAFKKLSFEIERFKPDIVLALGLSSRRNVISLEKVAINLIDCEYPDNDGKTYRDVPVISGAPNAYFSKLPLKEMLNVSQGKFATEISYSAGTYVCNYLMYNLLHLEQKSNFTSGFIHLPELKGNQEEILTSLNSILALLA